MTFPLMRRGSAAAGGSLVNTRERIPVALPLHGLNLLVHNPWVMVAKRPKTPFTYVTCSVLYGNNGSGGGPPCGISHPPVHKSRQKTSGGNPCVSRSGGSSCKEVTRVHWPKRASSEAPRPRMGKQARTVLGTKPIVKAKHTPSHTYTHIQQLPSWSWGVAVFGGDLAKKILARLTPCCSPTPKKPLPWAASEPMTRKDMARVLGNYVKMCTRCNHFPQITKNICRPNLEALPQTTPPNQSPKSPTPNLSLSKIKKTFPEKSLSKPPPKKK